MILHVVLKDEGLRHVVTVQVFNLREYFRLKLFHTLLYLYFLVSVHPTAQLLNFADKDCTHKTHNYLSVNTYVRFTLFILLLYLYLLYFYSLVRSVFIHLLSSLLLWCCKCPRCWTNKGLSYPIKYDALLQSSVVIVVVYMSAFCIYLIPNTSNIITEDFMHHVVEFEISEVFSHSHKQLLIQDNQSQRTSPPISIFHTWKHNLSADWFDKYVLHWHTSWQNECWLYAHCDGLQLVRNLFHYLQMWKELMAACIRRKLHI